VVLGLGKAIHISEFRMSLNFQSSPGIFLRLVMKGLELDLVMLQTIQG
jgi:hypothetical protein